LYAPAKRAGAVKINAEFGSGWHGPGYWMPWLLDDSTLQTARRFVCRPLAALRNCRSYRPSSRAGHPACPEIRGEGTECLDGVTEPRSRIS
jgi:hypothetical protein